MKSKLDSFIYYLTFRKQIHDNVNININVIIRDWESFDTLFFFLPNRLPLVAQLTSFRL